MGVGSKLTTITTVPLVGTHTDIYFLFFLCSTVKSTFLLVRTYWSVGGGGTSAQEKEEEGVRWWVVCVCSCVMHSLKDSSRTIFSPPFQHCQFVYSTTRYLCLRGLDKNRKIERGRGFFSHPLHFTQWDFFFLRWGYGKGWWPVCECSVKEERKKKDENSCLLWWWERNFRMMR